MDVVEGGRGKGDGATKINVYTATLSLPLVWPFLIFMPVIILHYSELLYFTQGILIWETQQIFSTLQIEKHLRYGHSQAWFNSFFFYQFIFW